MTFLALGVMQRPGGIARQRLDLRRRRLDLEFRTQAIAHGQRKSELPFLQPVGQPGRQAERRSDVVSVEGGRRIGFDRARDIALHEQPLAVVKRRQPRMTAAQGSCLVRHAEQGADEVLERARDLDQEIGLILGRQLVRLGTRRHEPRMGIDIGVL